MSRKKDNSYEETSSISVHLLTSRILPVRLLPPRSLHYQYVRRDPCFHCTAKSRPKVIQNHGSCGLHIANLPTLCIVLRTLPRSPRTLSQKSTSSSTTVLHNLLLRLRLITHCMHPLPFVLTLQACILSLVYSSRVLHRVDPMR